MPNVRSSLLAAALLVLAGCSLVPGDDEERPAPPAPSGTSYAAAPDVVAGVERTLAQRAAAVVAVDADVFGRGVAGPADFRAAQATWFANLRQLPVGELGYTVDPATMVRQGDDYWVVVEQRLRLDGYDAVPVVTRDRWRFRPAAKQPDRMVLTSVTDADWESENDVHPAPWELGPVQVRSAEGVLGVFDDASLAAAPRLLRSVERGIEQVAARVPYEWMRSVVVYALADPSYLAGIPDVPGGDPDDLDGVAFPVPAAPGEAALAATRFALHPRMLDRPGPARDRLVRHELTHVALGPRDDGAPLWLSEGVAEYVSAQPMAPRARRVPQRAVEAAQAGFVDLPADDAFDEAAAVAYAEAWWACEYLARSFDESVLWSLLDALGAGTAGDPGQVLHDLLGVWPSGLARRAGELIVAEYGEPPPVVPPVVPPAEVPTEAPVVPTQAPTG